MNEGKSTQTIVFVGSTSVTVHAPRIEAYVVHRFELKAIKSAFGNSGLLVNGAWFSAGTAISSIIGMVTCWRSTEFDKPILVTLAIVFSLLTIFLAAVGKSGASELSNILREIMERPLDKPDTTDSA